MALTIITTPDPVVFSRNEISVRVKTDALYTSTGSLAELGFRKTVAWLAGDTFTLSCAFFSLTFTMSASPDDSGLQIQIVGGGTMAQRSVIVDALRNNYLVMKYFEVSAGASTNQIFLQARGNGADYTITFSSSSVNINTYTNVAGTDAVLKENFKIRLQILIADGNGTSNINDFTIIEELDQIPDVNGLAEWNIQDVINDYVSFELLPVHTTNSGTSNLSRRFLLRACEFYGSTPEPRLATSVVVFNAIYGGYSSQAFRGGKNIYDRINVTGDLSLMARPATKVVSRTSLEYVFFISNLLTGQVDLVADIYFNDGTTSTAQVLRSITPTSADFIMCIPATFAALNLPSYETPDKKILKYTLQLKKSGTPCSPVYTRMVDQKYHRNKRQLVFGTSTGAFEGIECTGRSQANADVLFDEYSKVIGVAPTVSQEEYGRSRGLLNETVTVTIGNIQSREEKRYLLDLILSEKAFEYIEGYEVTDLDITTGYYIPIRIKNKKQPLTDTDETFFDLTIEYEYAISNTSV